MSAERSGPVLLRELMIDVTLKRGAEAEVKKPQPWRPIIIRERVHVLQ